MYTDMGLGKFSFKNIFNPKKKLTTKINLTGIKKIVKKGSQLYKQVTGKGGKVEEIPITQAEASQIQTAQAAASPMAKWVLPVGIGAGVLVLVMALKKRR